MNAPLSGDALFRARHVGAGEASALFDCNPWLTRFELFHRKAGTIATPEFNARNPDGTPVNARIHWGVKLERLIAEEAIERWNYQRVERTDTYDNGEGLGGHPDEVVWCPERQCLVVLEIKTVDWLERKKWGDEPPAQYLIQPNTYAGLAGAKAFDVIAFVMGGQSDLERHQYAFRPKLYAETEVRVRRFWADIAAGNTPPVDYARDGRTLVDVIGDPTDEVADLRDNSDAEQDAIDFLAAKARAKAAEADMDTAKARLMERIGAAGTALLMGHRIGANRTKDTPDREAVAGEIIKGRKGYRRFDVKGIS